MKIRTRLTIQFSFMVAAILCIALLLIYYFSSKHREKEFQTRLKNKALTTAKLIVQVERVDKALMKIIDKKEKSVLFEKNVVIYDYKNRVLYNYDSTRTIRISPDILERIRLEGEIDYYSGKYQVTGVLFIDKYNKFVVLASAYDEFGYDKLKNLRLILFGVFGISVLIASISGWFFSGKALQPIARVVSDVEKIGGSNLEKRISEGNGKDEIAILSKTFNKMLSRIENTIKIQKDFVTNASHELRTPLTVINGQIDVALLKDRTNEEYKNALKSVLEDIHALTVLSNNLLSLSKVNLDLSNSEIERIRIDDLLWQARTDLITIHPEYKIKIQFKKEIDNENDLFFRCNGILLKTAFINLMGNACKFSKDQTCRIYIENSDNSLNIDFTDKGIGISPEDQKNIFYPFYRGKNSTLVKGHGIGLSLVDRIIALHGGTINLISEVDKGSSFKIFLPH